MIGSTLGKYRIVRKLGEGGMGGVYEATHTTTGRRVAVKIIAEALAADEAMLERFEREALAAGAIDSEHVTHVLDFGKDDATGCAYLSMEYLEGEDLSRLAQRVTPMPPELVLKIASQVCSGLQKAHAAGIVHRDIKAANIFAAHKDEGAVVIKLLDFGVAKLRGTEFAPAENLTKTGGMVGTPHYMSPEQARGAKDLDHRTDIWSVGVVMYRLLTGRLPNEDVESVGELLYQLVTSKPKPIQDLAPWVPSDVAQIAHKALRTEPANRFQSATEMLEAIKPLLPSEGRGITLDMLKPVSEDLRQSVATRMGDTLTPPSLNDAARASTIAEAGRRLASSRVTAAGPSRVTAAGPSRVTTDSTRDAWDSGSSPPRGSAQAKTAVPATKKPMGVYAFVGVAVVGLAGFGIWRVTRPAQAVGPVASSSAAASGSAPANATSANIDPERLESFGALPSVVTSDTNPLNDAKIKLGRMLFFDPRLSKDKDISCASCHTLDKYGVDGAKLSTGHNKQLGTRNTPTVYNAAGYFALMWDGRAQTIEDQAKIQLANPIEMNMTPKLVEERVRAVAAYVALFAEAFPDDKKQVSFENVSKAIAAFERKLFTPSRWEKFIGGEKDAITAAEKAGFNAFVDVGCPTCHFGPYIGASMYQKLGLVKAWPYTRDRGRFEITNKQEDYMVFRVPSLRNIAKTGPYFHDGSKTSLEEVVKMMARHQVGKELTDEQTVSIVAWLGALTGDLPADYIQKPELP